MKNAILTSILCFSHFFATAQGPTIAWQKTIGGSDFDMLRSARQTVDGGYILGGYSSSNISGNKTENRRGFYDFWIVKTDSTGKISWQKTIGGNGFNFLCSVEPTSDGGYILGGHSNANISGEKTENSRGGYDFWVLKLDATGNIIWQKTIGGSGNDELQAIQPTSDGGYILGGQSKSNISGDKTENCRGGHDFWVVKLDAVGKIIWQKTVGGSDADELNAIQQTSDGGYILGGASKSNISGEKTENSAGDSDFWLVKLDAAGQIIWQNTICGDKSDELQAVQQTTDGGYILGGNSASNISGDKSENSLGGSDFWILKTDASGNILWQNTIGGNNPDYLQSISQTADGGYFVGGSSSSHFSGDKTENSQGNLDVWVLILDADGKIIWQKTKGGSDFDELYAAQPTSDGGFILGGYSSSNLGGDKTENSHGGADFWILKFTAPCFSFNFSLALVPQPCDASTKINVSGLSNSGAGTYFFNINGGQFQTADVFTVHDPGIYTVVARDVFGCTNSQTVTVASIIPSLVTTVKKNHVLCFGESTGTATAQPKNGTQPYTFQWKKSNEIIGTEENIEGLTAGFYRLKVTDAFGCQTSANVTIKQPNKPLILEVFNILPQGDNFKVRLVATGAAAGAKKYRRCDSLGMNCTDWQSSKFFQHTPAGKYQFEIKDQNNCTATVISDVPLAQKPAAADRSSEQDLEAYSLENQTIGLAPNPFFNQMQLARDEDFTENLDVKILDLNGRIIFEKQWPAGFEKLEIQTERLAAGVYFIQILDKNGLLHETHRAVKTN